MKRLAVPARKLGIWLIGWSNKQQPDTKVIIRHGSAVDLCRWLSILQADDRRQQSRESHPSRVLSVDEQIEFHQLVKRIEGES